MQGTHINPGGCAPKLISAIISLPEICGFLSTGKQNSTVFKDLSCGEQLAPELNAVVFIPARKGS